MPLKIVCKRCGELVYYASAIMMAKDASNFCVPEVLRRLNNQCPSCGRIITMDDVANMNVHVTGQRGNVEFYMRHSKAKHRRRKQEAQFLVEQLCVDNDFPARIEPIWYWINPQGKKEILAR